MDTEKVNLENQSPTVHKAKTKLWFYALSAYFCAGFVISWLYDLLIRGIEPQFRNNLEVAIVITFNIALGFSLIDVLSQRGTQKRQKNSQK